MVVGLGALGGAGALVGARVEAEAFILRRVTAPVLPVGARPLRVLQVTDLHLTPGDRRRVAWTRGLAALEPDLVVDTGDNLAHPDAVPTVLEALGSLVAVPGVFVFGSNDYFAPRWKNPLGYFRGPSRTRTTVAATLPTEELRRELAAAGWLDLNNHRARMDLLGQPISFVGMDDPHVRKDRMPAPEHQTEVPGVVADDLRIGVVHAPYLRALDALVADGSDLLLAGHTHGGQVCLPFAGALVTNCDLPRRYAKGLHTWTRQPGRGGGAEPPARPASRREHPLLHVSAGLGTSPYARIRLFCRPEATLLTLVPTDYPIDA